jgi:hypothetical protein
MTPPRFEVADVIRDHGGEFLDTHGDTTSPEQRRALTDLARCRTAALGGHVEECDRCGHRQVAYNSCRNRHCPKCQAAEAARWVEDRAAELLPVEYFHVVFTLPAALAPIALQNPRVVYGLLFLAAAETLQQIAADPEHLGAEIGFPAVLHTWGQNLQHHPHIHCVVPSGGLSLDHQRWIRPRYPFFLPVKVLSRVFRGKFVAGLKRAFRQGKLVFPGSLQPLATEKAFRAFLRPLFRQDWIVYAKRPFGGPEHVLYYLARYSHRVAISNHRLLSVADGKVTFRWKDYAHGSQQRQMTLTATEFLRRFFLHVLPKSFVRIRHFGFLANRIRASRLQLCRQLLTSDSLPTQATLVPTTATSIWHCPRCGTVMIVIQTFTAEQLPSRCDYFDSS